MRAPGSLISELKHVQSFLRLDQVFAQHAGMTVISDDARSNGPTSGHNLEEISRLVEWRRVGGHPRRLDGAAGLRPARTAARLRRGPAAPEVRPAARPQP